MKQESTLYQVYQGPLLEVPNINNSLLKTVPEIQYYLKYSAPLKIHL